MDSKENTKSDLPQGLVDAVLKKSDNAPSKTIIKGYDFNDGLDYEKLLDSYKNVGFQASSFGKSIDIVNKMLNWRLSDEPIAENEQDEYLDEEVRKNTKCTIFLGYTSNLVSAGLRENIRYLVEHKLVDCIVTSAGGIEEDFIKCLAPTFLGEFHVDDLDYRKRGLNRTGNLIVPNDNYCKFEDWVMPLLDEMWEEQQKKGTHWTPSRLIKRLGERINNPESIYYWAAKNDIPVFCPALTDGSLGDMLFFHSYRKQNFIVDIVADIREINRLALKAKKTGVIILGGGIIKHHILNANLMRNGADYAVYINTGQEFDGSDAGARPNEALSWGKLRMTSEYTKIYSDATLVFPLLIAKTFVPYLLKQSVKSKDEKESTTTEEKK